MTIFEFLYIMLVVFITNFCFEFVKNKIHERNENKIYRVYINNSFHKECSLKESRDLYETHPFTYHKSFGIDRKEKVVNIIIDNKY